MHLVAIILNFHSLFGCVWSANAFFNPPGPDGRNGYYADNNVYSLGNKINIRWETNFEAVDLILWQQSDSSESIGAKIGSQYSE